MTNPRRLVPAEESHAGAVAVLEREARELPLEDLPVLAGELARLGALISLRIAAAAVGAGPRDRGRPLLTVEALAAKLGISEANVYARAKTDLRGAAVDVGAGQLRFDPQRVERFIEARRRLLLRTE